MQQSFLPSEPTKFDLSKLNSLGVHHITLEQSVVDTVESAIAKGMLQPVAKL